MIRSIHQATAIAAGAALATGLAALALASGRSLGGLVTSTPTVGPSAAHAAYAAHGAPPFDSSVSRGAIFRPSRAPAPMAFDPLGQQTPPVAPEAIPVLTLVGVVLGPSAAAVIRGIPGLDVAQVLEVGEERAGVRLVRIDSAGVTLLWRADSVRLALPREGT